MTTKLLLPGSGKIIYDPHRANMKRRTTGWCIVEVDREITRYYRYWLDKKLNPLGITGQELKQPSWDAHISVVRGEKLRPSVEHLWKKYHGQQVDFEYDHSYVRCEPDKKLGGHYYWVDVYSPFLDEIRKELQLPVGWKLHLTVGRTYE